MFKQFHFVEGDVIAFNYGFGQREEGTITYVCQGVFCVNGLYHYAEEPSISQVRFLKLSPARTKAKTPIEWIKLIVKRMLGIGQDTCLYVWRARLPRVNLALW